MRNRIIELKQMDARKFTRFLENSYACDRAKEWRKTQKHRDLRSIVAACDEPSWLLWLLLVSAKNRVRRRKLLMKLFPSLDRFLGAYGGVSIDQVRSIIRVVDKKKGNKNVKRYFQ